MRLMLPYLSLFLFFYLGVAVPFSPVVASARPRDSIASTTMPRVSRVPYSFYCKATPHIVQGRVIHFLPDSAQLFINCCSLGERTGPTCRPLSMRCVAAPALLFLSDSNHTTATRNKKEIVRFEAPYTTGLPDTWNDRARDVICSLACFISSNVCCQEAQFSFLIRFHFSIITCYI